MFYTQICVSLSFAREIRLCKCGDNFRKTFHTFFGTSFCLDALPCSEPIYSFFSLFLFFYLCSILQRGSFILFFFWHVVYIVCKARALHREKKEHTKDEMEWRTKKKREFQNWDKTFRVLQKGTSIEAKLCGKQDSIITSNFRFLLKKIIRKQGENNCL